MKRERKRKTKLSSQVERASKRKIERDIIDTKTLIPSGATLLNCACSDNPFGAFALGRIVTLPGQSAGGKTMQALTMLAMAANDKRFDNYDLIYDDGEESLTMDIEYLFGKKLFKNLEAPQWDEEEDEAKHSNTIQDFKANVLNRCKEKKSFIYVLDSLDSLTTDEELAKEYTKAIAKAKSDDAVKELKGSYKTEKAKHMGEALRMIKGSLAKTDSALFIVQQIRDKIGATFGKKTTTSGGKAPFFYSTHQIWFNKVKTLTKTVNKITRKTGVSVNAEVTKNKVTGKIRDVDFDIYYDYGIDDISSMVNFLVKANHWKKRKETIIAPELDMEASRIKLIEMIENERLEKKIQKITGKAWNNIEESVKMGRSRHFG